MVGELEMRNGRFASAMYSICIAGFVGGLLAWWMYPRPLFVQTIPVKADFFTGTNAIPFSVPGSCYEVWSRWAVLKEPVFLNAGDYMYAAVEGQEQRPNSYYFVDQETLQVVGPWTPSLQDENARAIRPESRLTGFLPDGRFVAGVMPYADGDCELQYFDPISQHSEVVRRDFIPGLKAETVGRYSFGARMEAQGWVSTDRSIMVLYHEKPEVIELIVVDVASATIQCVIELKPDDHPKLPILNSLQLSPNGELIALPTSVKSPNGEFGIELISTRSGRREFLIRDEGSDRESTRQEQEQSRLADEWGIYNIKFSPDGNDLMYTFGRPNFDPFNDVVRHCYSLTSRRLRNDSPPWWIAYCSEPAAASPYIWAWSADGNYALWHSGHQSLRGEPVSDSTLHGIHVVDRDSRVVLDWRKATADYSKMPEILQPESTAVVWLELDTTSMQQFFASNVQPLLKWLPFGISIDATPSTQVAYFDFETNTSRSFGRRKTRAQDSSPNIHCQPGRISVVTSTDNETRIEVWKAPPGVWRTGWISVFTALLLLVLYRYFRRDQTVVHSQHSG